MTSSPGHLFRAAELKQSFDSRKAAQSSMVAFIIMLQVFEVPSVAIHFSFLSKTDPEILPVLLVMQRASQ